MENGSKKSKNRIKTKRRYSGSERRSGYYNHFDFLLLTFVVIISIFGLIMMYSIGGKSKVINQGVFFAIGYALIAFFAFVGTEIPFENFRRFVRAKGRYKHRWANEMFEDLVSIPGIILIVATFLQFLVLVPGIGMEVNGARRWFNLGICTLQPAEITKIAVIIFTAYIGYTRAARLDKIRVIQYFGYVLPAIGAIAIENLSSAIIVAGIAFLVYFVVARNKFIYIAMFVAAFMLIVVYLSMGDDYRGNRYKNWKEVENYDLNSQQAKDSQVLQGLFCIANGGVKGTGFGRGVQKKTLPESGNDMIFAVICEELGLIGAGVLVLIYLAILWRIMIIGKYACSLFQTLVCYGVMAHMGLQVVLNIMVVTNSIPNTGVSLPFVSAGGTATVLQLVEIGFVLMISWSMKHENK